VDGEISRPETGEDGFDYARYLSTKRISAVVEATSVWPVDEDLGWIGRVHRRSDVALGYGLHPQEAAVVRGMVLGDRSLIPEELEEAFQRSGITHVLAISGQHVAVLAAVIYFSLRTFAVPAATRILTTLVLIWLYILVSGAPPSAIRAGVLATFVLAAGLLGRQISALHFTNLQRPYGALLRHVMPGAGGRGGAGVAATKLSAGLPSSGISEVRCFAQRAWRGTLHGHTVLWGHLQRFAVKLAYITSRTNSSYLEQPHNRLLMHVITGPYHRKPL